VEPGGVVFAAGFCMKRAVIPDDACAEAADSDAAGTVVFSVGPCSGTTSDVVTALILLRTARRKYSKTIRTGISLGNQYMMKSAIHDCHECPQIS
jgi:carboxypeptidase C (cathepsin A)